MTLEDVPKSYYFIARKFGYFVLYRKNQKGLYSTVTINGWFTDTLYLKTMFSVLSGCNSTYFRRADINDIENPLYIFRDYKDIKDKYPEEFI